MTGSPSWLVSGPQTESRTWADVARETRAIYAAVGVERGPVPSGL